MIFLKVLAGIAAALIMVYIGVKNIRSELS
jgi:hypothetical protein